MAGEMIMATKASVVIYVDEVDGGAVKGSFQHMVQEKERPFSSFGDLILELDCMMDALGEPQSYTERRRWETPHNRRRRPAPKCRKMLGRKAVQRRGRAATVVLYIHMRRNSTWQGELIWIEVGKSVFFRSALELLHLLETAVAAEPYEKMGRLEPEQTFFKP